MVVINKGIAKAVKEAFINGVHEPEQMLVKLAHLNTDEHRKAYLVQLTKGLREKHGMNTKRNKKHKKTNSKAPKQMALNFTKEPKFYNEKSRELAMTRHERSPKITQIAYGQHDLADAMRKHDMSNMADRTYDDAPKQRISDEDRIVEEYVKLDDAHKALQMMYDDIVDKNVELKREIIRLQVIIDYLEGKK
jgi:hypothetical protein